MPTLVEVLAAIRDDFAVAVLIVVCGMIAYWLVCFLCTMLFKRNNNEQ